MNIKKKYNNSKYLFSNWIYLNIFCDGKVEFSASLLQSSVSHDPSEINLICRFAVQEKKILNVENSCAVIYTTKLAFTSNYTSMSSDVPAADSE